MVTRASGVVEVSFVGNAADLIATMERAGLVAKASGDTIGSAFTKGSSVAGSAISKLASEGQKLGIPLSGSIAKFGTALDQATTKTAKLSTVLSTLGKVGVAGGLAAFAAAAYEGVKGATALQQQMEMIHTQAGKSQVEVNNMTKAVLGMAASVGTNPQQLAQALYHIESAGYSGAQALNMLKVSAQGAKIGNADLTETAQALAAAMYSGIPGAQTMSQAMGVLNATVGAGDMTMQQLNEAFQGPMLATVKGYGLSIQDVGAALADFGDLNIRGADAATQLRMAVQYMAKPAATAGPMLKALGLNTQSFANAMANGGLMPALDLLKSKLDAANVPANKYAQVISDLFSKKGSAGVEILLNSLGRVQSKVQDMQKGAGSFGADWTATTHNLAFEWSQLEAGAAAFADKLGGYLIPKLQQLGTFVANHEGLFKDLAHLFEVVMTVAIAKWVSESTVAFGKWILGFKGVATAAVEQAGIISGAQGIAGVATAAEGATSKLGLMKNALKALPSLTDITIAITLAETVLTIAKSLSDQTPDAINGDKAISKMNGAQVFAAETPPDVLAALKAQRSKITTPAAAAKFLQSQGYSKSDWGSDWNYEVQSLLGYLGVPIINKNGGVGSTYGPAVPKNYKPPTTSSGGGSGGGINPAVSNALAGGGSTTNTTAKLTQADIDIENLANRFLGKLRTAGAGGTSRSEQGKTIADILSITHGSPSPTGAVAAMVNSLNATQNPTLVKLAATITSTWAQMASKITTIVDSDTKAGQSELTKLQNAANSTSAASLKDALTGTAQTSFNQLVTELNSTHQKSLESLAKNLEAQWATTNAAYQSVLATLSTTFQADNLQQTVAQIVGSTTAAQNAGSAALQFGVLGSSLNGQSSAADVGNEIGIALANKQSIGSLGNQMVTDQLNAAATAMKDAATLESDAAQAQTQAIQAQITASNDAATAQVNAINDQTQTQVDTLAERGLYGLALQAQMAKVALDQQVAADHASEAAAQAHLDQVTAQTNAAVSDAQMRSDQVQQQADQAEAQAQATADSTAITSAISVAAAQAEADQAAITAAINNAAAQAHVDAVQFGNQQQQQQAAATQKLVQAQGDNATALANSNLTAVTNSSNQANQDAQNSYSQAQAYWNQQLALASKALTTAQSNASVQQALAQQSLSAVQNTASITEAKLTSIYNVDQEMANVAYAGSGVSIYITGLPADNAAAIGAAASYALRYKVA